MKLFTAIYDDARLLGYFLRHYDRRGISQFFIAASPAFAPVVRGFTNQYRISVFEGLDVADSYLGGTAAVTEMRRMHQQDAEWVVIVDLDEFVEFVPDIYRVVSAAEREAANVVRGIMYDRFSLGGELVDFEQEADLAKLFPVTSRFIATVMRGCDHKGVLVKGQLKAAGAHHVFEGETVFSETLEIGHYKWFAGAIDRLKMRYTVLADVGTPWAIEYKRAIDHYEQYGRFVWEEFGGELTDPDRGLSNA
jgi:hypothetical protein